MSKVKSARAKMPKFIEPCLASLVQEPPDGTQWAHEIKFDGYRLQAHIDDGRVRLLTRSGLDWTHKFAALAQSISELKFSTAILDGEVVVEDANGVSRFVELVSDLKHRQSARMVFYVFDLLYHDGSDLRHLALTDRKAALKRLLPRRAKHRAIRHSDHVIGHGETMLTQACELGLEGIVSKRLDQPYRSGRGNIWLKTKCIHTDEFVIVGYLASNAIKDAVGALVVGFYDRENLIYAGRVGTGFSKSMAAELWTKLQSTRLKACPLATPVDAVQAKNVMWVRPRLVAQVGYGGWTVDGLLRHAAFKALRADKRAKTVIDPRAKSG